MVWPEARSATPHCAVASQPVGNRQQGRMRAGSRKRWRLLLWREATRSLTLALFFLQSRNPCFHHFLQQRRGQGLIDRELNCAFGCSEALQFASERFDHGWGREEAAVVFKGGVPHE